jgi:hypothetical protein
MLPTGPAPADEELAAYCPDLDQWPKSWMYEEHDGSPGRQMVECFKPFLRHLLSLGLSRKTLRRHRDNLWLLGGELIRALHDAPRLRKRPMDHVVLAALDREGGSLISHGTSEDRNAPSTPPAESSIASSPTAAVHRQSGCGHVDNAEEAFPTCPQPQQMQNAKHGTISTKEAAVRFTSIRHIAHIRRAPPTDSPEEAIKRQPADFVP